MAKDKAVFPEVVRSAIQAMVDGGAWDTNNSDWTAIETRHLAWTLVRDNLLIYFTPKQVKQGDKVLEGKELARFHRAQFDKAFPEPWQLESSNCKKQLAEEGLVGGKKRESGYC